MKKPKTTKRISEDTWKDQMNALLELKDSFGWEILNNNIEVNLKATNDAILTKFSAMNEKLTDEEVDLLRERRDLYLILQEMPSLLINNLSEVHKDDGNEDKEPFENFDPYEQYQSDNKKTPMKTKT